MASRKNELGDLAATIKKKAARVPMTDDDLLVLACEEIARSVSYEEMQYCTGAS